MNTMQGPKSLLCYEFTLTFTLPGPDMDPESFLGALLENNCDDSTVGIGLSGHIAMMFSRRATSAEAALLSALRDVTRAIPGALLVTADPDLVGLTDIADLLGFSRQNMRKLQIANAATFPPPIHQGSSMLWHLASVLDWFKQTKGKAIDKALADVAQVTMQLNIARDSTLLDKKFLARVQRYL